MVSKSKLTHHPRLQIGLIGVGYWGSKILQTLSKMKEIDTVHLVDIHQAKLPNGKHLGKKESLESVLNNQNISHVLIATPEETHIALAKDALLHNKHVFVEKPLSLTRNEAKVVISLAKKKKLRLFVDRIFLFDPYIHTIKKLIQSPNFGKLLCIHVWRHSTNIGKKSISVYQDLAPHDIYLGKYFFESHCTSSKIEPIFIKDSQIFEAQVLFNYPTGIMQSEYSWVQPTQKRKMEFIGTMQTIVWDKQNQCITCTNLSDNTITYHKPKLNISALETSIRTFISSPLNKTEENDYLMESQILEQLSVLESPCASNSIV